MHLAFFLGIALPIAFALCEMFSPVDVDQQEAADGEDH